MPDLKVGDILVQGKFHALMWVGGEKPIVHNANKGKFHGVMQQSLKGALIGTKADPMEFFGSSNPLGYKVYRCSDGAVAEGAAKYAKSWAVESESQEMNRALVENGGRLKVAYSDDRMVYAEYDAKPEERQWNVNSMYRALKAYARYEAVLTPKKGSSCSQFIVYCFQAASIKQMFGELNISPKSLELLKSGGGSMKLKARATESEDFKNLLNQVEEAADRFEKSALPMLKSNAKVEYVGSLIERLNESNSGFAPEGYLVPTSTIDKAVIAPLGDYKDWTALGKAVGIKLP